MKKLLIQTGLVCLFLAVCLSANAATATFRIVNDPLPQTWANFALSGDGTVMAANYGGEIYRWTAATGFQDLGPGDSFNSSIGISQDGSTIISGYVGADGISRPAIWNANGMVDLGHPTNGCSDLAYSWGSGYGLNADGSVAVGLAWTCNAAEGFMWSANGGNISLGHPSGNHSSRASAISANSKTVVGFWEDKTGPRRPVRWVNGNHHLFLGASTLGEATAVTSDGKTIVGQFYNAQNNGTAFLWSPKGGFVSLGTIDPYPRDESFANGISDNGVVVGWSGNMFGRGIRAFIWTSATGTVHLEKTLRHMGAKIPSGMTLVTAVSISSDGSTIAGQAVDTQNNVSNWIAHITE
jgi:uncharacterized membrane protein